MTLLEILMLVLYTITISVFFTIWIKQAKENENAEKIEDVRDRWRNV